MKQRLFLPALAIAACSSSPSANDGGAGGATGTGGSGGGGCPAVLTSTVHGAGFDAWEGEPVSACLNAAQSGGTTCGDTTVSAGEFSVTESECTAYDWMVTIGSGPSAITCRQTEGDGHVPLTPANCSCSGGGGTGGVPATGCARDASPG